MLRQSQIELFKRDGVLILRGLFSADEVSAWREQILEYYGQPGSPGAWWKALATPRPSRFHLQDDPVPGTHPALKHVYDSLHSSALWAGDNELVIRAGEDDAPWLGARAPHLDFPLHAPVRTLANNVAYLSDVEEQGGAFMYWPGSHQIAWDYFRRHPDDYLSRGERSQDQTFAMLKREMVCDPIEFVGQAGDVLIWHSLLLHSGSVNKRHEARLALFGRWGVTLGEEPVYDFNADMWSYWRFTKQDLQADNYAGACT